MRLYFILFVFILASCGRHSNSEFVLQNSLQIKPKTLVCLNEQDCFYFSTDSSLSEFSMYYSNVGLGVKKKIGTVDSSPYTSKIHSFKLQVKKSYVVLWETEYEYYPLIYAYYIKDGKLVNMGELLISLPCQSCESFEYPIKDIQICQKEEEIEISFLKDVNYKPRNSNNWRFYKAGELKCLFNIKTGKLRYIFL